jgi:hypothetical protein
MIFETLQKKNTKLYANFFGLSGCGKTYSALTLATNLASRNEKVLIIDTEHRADIYAEIFNGVKIYKKRDIQILETLNVIEEAKKQNFEVVIIDSLTPLWDGKNGIATEAMKDVNSKHGQNWRKPKQTITAFTQALKCSGLHIITTSLAKNKLDKDMKETDEIEPIFEKPKFEPYLDLQILLEKDGSIKNIKKGMHPDIKKELINQKIINKDLSIFIKNWIGVGKNCFQDNTFKESIELIKEEEIVEGFFQETKNYTKEQFLDFYKKLNIEQKKIYDKNADLLKKRREEYKEFLIQENEFKKEEKKVANAFEVENILKKEEILDKKESLSFMNYKKKLETKTTMEEIKSFQNIFECIFDANNEIKTEQERIINDYIENIKNPPIKKSLI